MNMFKQNKLVAAVAIGLGVASSGAGAVSLNADGVGEALVYPYYTARNGQTTLLSVVNTTNAGKAVKVRFREARNSNDVLDFNLYLSPYDVWTGAVNQKGTGSYLATSDTSCTNPAKSAWDAIDATNRVYGKAFFPYDYDSVDNTTSSSQGLDRTLEGYVEIIEMATIPTNSTYYTAIKHSNGVPPCEANAAAAALFGSGTVTSPGNLTVPSGGLFGAVSQINTSGGVSGGVSTAEAAVAYNNFNRGASVFDPSSANPNFADHASCRALVNDGHSVALMNTETVTGTCDPVVGDTARAFAAVNMASSVQGEFSFFRSADGGTAVHGTDWVITMPGKHYFTNLSTWVTSTGDPHGYATGTASSQALAPFLNPTANGTAMWSQTNKVSCLTISTTTYSREEDTAGGTGSGFSPRPPGTPPNSLCYEANVISFGQPATTSGPSAVFASPLALWLNPTFSRSNTGWLDLPLTTSVPRVIGGPVVGQIFNLSTGTSVAANSVTVSGLPVIGFKSTVSRVTAVSAGTPLNNYNDSVPLTFRRTITTQ